MLVVLSACSPPPDPCETLAALNESKRTDFALALAASAQHRVELIEVNTLPAELRQEARSIAVEAYRLQRTMEKDAMAFLNARIAEVQHQCATPPVIQ